MKALVPKLRFKEFTDEWQVRKLGDISTKVGSGSTPRGGSAVYKSSGIPFIRSQNVVGGQLLLDDAAFIDQATHVSMRNSSIAPNDVLLNITGASLGRSCVVPLNFKEGNVNQHVCIIRLKGNNNAYLVHTLLSRPRGLHELLKTQTGGGKEGLNFQAVKAFKVSLPSKPEQEKIAGFLTIVDKRVELVEKRMELLKKYKNGMMQKIFTQKIRFKDENGNNYPDWGNEELGKVSLVISGQSPDGNAYNTEGEGLPLYQGKADFGAMFTAEPEVWTTQQTKIAEKNDILMSVRAPVGPTNFASQRMNIGRGLAAIRSWEGTNQKFLFYFLRYIEHKITALGGGSTFGSITSKDLKGIKILQPNHKEQQKIADFLTSLDDKIKIEEEKLTQAKNFKKSLLQRMFV